MSKSIDKWSANWIWCQPEEDDRNQHLLVRREFSLDNLPESMYCFVSANSIYELYINGKKVGRGPNPSYPKWQYYDAYDVSAYLRDGENVIAAYCYNFGTQMQSVLDQCPGPGGFILQLESEGLVELTTDGEWRILYDPPQKRFTDPISGHRGGFEEVYDAGKEVLGWKDLGFDDSSWPKASVLGSVGCEPWTNLIPREIPYLRYERVFPQDAFFHTCGLAYGGTKYDVQAPDSLWRDDDSCAIVEPLRKDFSPSIIVDFGVSIYGYFELEIVDSQGGIIELSYGESLNMTHVDTLIMRKGYQKYRPFERRGGRYLMLTFSDCPGPVLLRRVVCYRQSYPVKYSGDFHCSDELLNRIWEVGQYTVQMCMQDHYEDCPWREQTLYSGDLAVGALLSYYAFGTQDLARKAFRQFARLQDENGLIPALGPTPSTALPYLAEYPAFWVIALWDYYMYWGDEDLLQEVFTTLKACMRWYESHTDEDGLFIRLPDEPRQPFIDNLSNIPARDKLAAEHIIICEAHRLAAKIGEVLGDTEWFAEMRRKADRMPPVINRLFWSDQSQSFIDSLEGGRPTVTQITNGLALLYDITDSSKKWALFQVLLDPAKAPPIRAGYMNYYMIEALIHAGLFQEALDRIREYWGGMIARGATTFWEVFDPESPDGTMPERLWSLCHEFCAGPVYSLPANIGGIKPLEPGFQRVRVAPNLVDLDWVRTTVPTPNGNLTLICHQVRSNRQLLDMTLTLPPGTSAEILVPMRDRDRRRVYVNGELVADSSSQGKADGNSMGISYLRSDVQGVWLSVEASPGERQLFICTTNRKETVKDGRVKGPLGIDPNYAFWDE